VTLSDKRQHSEARERAQNADGAVLLPIAQAAARLGISRMTVYRRIKSGAWPSGRCGRNYLIPRAFIEGLLAEISAGRQIDHMDFAAAWFAQRDAQAVAS
jgi:excisionase family DNA binding protein